MRRLDTEEAATIGMKREVVPAARRHVRGKFRR
jgi:hypothetical protein